MTCTYLQVFRSNTCGGKSREGKFQEFATEAARRVAHSEANGPRLWAAGAHSTTLRTNVPTPE